MTTQPRLRRTIIVHNRLAGHMARVDAARTGAHGVQIMTMGQLAGRLAGGFLRPIDPEDLQDAVRAALPDTDLGELQDIKDLPGMVRASAATLEKVWNANIELASIDHPRTKALATLEREVLRRLPPSQKRPAELVESGCRRLRHAAALLGEIEIHGHSEMSPCWRPLLEALAKTVGVRWIAGPRLVPRWLDRAIVSVVETAALSPPTTVYSCANPHHEAVEAFRWMRQLLANGIARPEEIAIVAASPGDFDDHILALSNDASLPIHFVHGIRAVTTRDGQTAAALAEVLVKGISQERVRRLLMLAGDGSAATKDLPDGWHRVLQQDASLTTLKRWESALGQVSAKDWPDGIDHSPALLGVIRALEGGPEAAEAAGDLLLPARAKALWRRALKDGPPQALPVTLARLRVDDGLEPAAHAIWTSAVALASAPRPHVWLLALNTGRWPRRISEDRLVPDHVIPIEKLDPLPIGDGDKRDFATILASAKAVSVSFSRRDVEGRLLGPSPLIADKEELYLSRGRIPDHATSESDRLLARPSEFARTAIAVSGLSCWRDWYVPEITAHDGFLPRAHPRIQKVLAARQSASSLRLLLRDPIRFVWKHALGWRVPEEAEEPLSLDALALGNLVHGVLQRAADILETGSGVARAKEPEIEAAIRQAVAAVAEEWERQQPVPPPIIWRSTLNLCRQWSLRSLRFPFPSLSGQKTWTEIPFGMQDDSRRGDLPWLPDCPVEIPGAGIVISGRIDRLDLSDDGARARVVDYKTGRVGKRMTTVLIDGGKELQRCLYAFAVKTLLKQEVVVDAALFYPRAAENEDAFFPLKDVDAVLAQLAKAIALAKTSLEEGKAPPGIDAKDEFNELGFALPATASYLPRKAAPAQELLGDAAKVWEEE